MVRPGGQWREGRRALERLRDWLHDDDLSSVRREPGRGRQALDALVDIGAIRRVLDQAELAAVRAARQHGKSWAEVATHLGVTRQSAWERWRDLDDPPGSTPGTASESAREVVLGVESAALADLAEQRARAARRRASVTVPNLVGLPWEEAQLKLTGMGLVTLAADPDGPPQGVAAASAVVADQSPEADAKVEPGSAVRLWIGRGSGSAGVREPRRPSPTPKPAREMRPEPADEAIG